MNFRGKNLTPPLKYQFCPKITFIPIPWWRFLKSSMWGHSRNKVGLIVLYSVNSLFTENETLLPFLVNFGAEVQ